MDDAISTRISKGFLSDLVRLENGELPSQVEVAVEAAGREPEADRSDVLVCHALTGDAHAVGDQEQPGWWDRPDRSRENVGYQSLPCVDPQCIGGMRGRRRVRPPPIPQQVNLTVLISPR